jgi:signal transduction histidine kinase
VNVMTDTVSREGPTASQARFARQIERNNYVAMVAHELRDPLMPIINAAAVLMHMPPDAALVLRSAAIIDRQARIMGGLIDDLMNVSRLQNGMLRLDRAPVSMAEIVRRCVETAGPFCEARQQHLRLPAPSPAIDLHADAARLIQAMRNLIVNASKFSGRGAEIRVLAEREGGEAVFQVVDDGIGIDPVDLEPIFSLFIQGGNQASRSNGGLGIGLFLARHYAEAHGGSLRATSPGPGKGSTFTLRVPCLPAGLRDAGATVNTPSGDPTPASQRHNTRTMPLRDGRDRGP